MSPGTPLDGGLITYTSMPSAAVYHTPSLLLVLGQAREPQDRSGKVGLGLVPIHPPYTDPARLCGFSLFQSQGPALSQDVAQVCLCPWSTSPPFMYLVNTTSSIHSL